MTKLSSTKHHHNNNHCQHLFITMIHVIEYYIWRVPVFVQMCVLCYWMNGFFYFIVVACLNALFFFVIVCWRKILTSLLFIQCACWLFWGIGVQQFLLNVRSFIVVPFSSLKNNLVDTPRFRFNKYFVSFLVLLLSFVCRWNSANKKRSYVVRSYKTFVYHVFLLFFKFLRWLFFGDFLELYYCDG